MKTTTVRRNTLKRKIERVKKAGRKKRFNFFFMNYPFDNVARALFWYYYSIELMQEQTNRMLDQFLEDSDVMTFHFPDELIDDFASPENVDVLRQTEHIDTDTRVSIDNVVDNTAETDESKLPKSVAARYKCKLCNHTYASTDGIAKHYRKKHTNIIKKKGKPHDYCVVVY